MSAPKIYTKRLLLREIKKKDIFEYYELFSNNETMKLFGGPPVGNDLEIKDSINQLKQEYENGQSIFWVVTITEEKEFIGFVRLMSYNSFYFDASYKSMGDLKYSQDFLQYIDKEKGWEIDYALLKGYRGQGIMTESLIAILNHCKENAISPIYAKVNNLKIKDTIRVLEKNNFKELMYQSDQKGELGMIYVWKN